jgi:fructose-bisphosphate aldolase class II
LHGGTGLSSDQFDDLIARGCAKINISTALKIAFMDGNREFFKAQATNNDPPALLKFVREKVKKSASEHIRMFHSDGKA